MSITVCGACRKSLGRGGDSGAEVGKLFLEPTREYITACYALAADNSNVSGAKNGYKAAATFYNRYADAAFCRGDAAALLDLFCTSA